MIPASEVERQVCRGSNRCLRFLSSLQLSDYAHPQGISSLLNPEFRAPHSNHNTFWAQFELGASIAKEWFLSLWGSEVRWWFVPAAKPWRKSTSERQVTLVAAFPFPHGQIQEKIELGIQCGVRRLEGVVNFYPLNLLKKCGWERRCVERGA